jgi:lambda repressor-like predicted transcriptional regulator
VRAALLLMGDRTIRDMAMDLRRRADHLSQVLNVEGYSKAGRVEIAGYLGVEVTDIWPPKNELNPACQPATGQTG